MTVGDIKDTVMFQTNNDTDDLEDFLPYLNDYINEGYDLLVDAWKHMHVVDSPTEGNPFAVLMSNNDIPKLPSWSHHAIADYATWLVYRNGSSPKQQRGYQFRQAFESVRLQLIALNGTDGSTADSGKVRNFYNIPD